MNRVRILAVGVMMSILLPGHLCAQAANIKELVKRESPAIVAVYSLNAQGEVQGTGTGFIVRADGMIITNFHVIKGASNALIKLRNGEVYNRVWVIDFHPRRDIAVLKIQAIGLPTVTLGDSEAVEQGDWCVAIGNPKGLEHTVSDGLISAMRIMKGNKMFQISTPISPGSSGGPLYNSQGEVIGITSAALVGEGVQNLNFAVPLKYSLPMMEGESRMTLAELAAQYGEPESATTSVPAGNMYTDPVGIATVTIEPGWKAGPGDVTGVIMSIKKDASYLQVMYMAGTTNINNLFEIGQNAAKNTLKKFKPATDLVRGDHKGRPVMVRFFTGKMQKAKLRVFVGAMITAKGGLLFLGFAPEERTDDPEAMSRMFLSLR